MFSYSYFSVSSKDKVGVFIITLVAFICYFQKKKYKAKKMREMSNHSRKSETMTNQPTYQLTGVGARDAFTSKNKEKCVLKALKLEH